jgi:hypothetical protein
LTGFFQNALRRIYEDDDSPTFDKLIELGYTKERIILLFKGCKMYNENERRLLGRASFYGVIITMILSIVSIYVINYLGYELTTRTLIMIPITILAVS